MHKKAAGGRPVGMAVFQQVIRQRAIDSYRDTIGAVQFVGACLPGSFDTLKCYQNAQMVEETAVVVALNPESAVTAMWDAVAGSAIDAFNEGDVSSGLAHAAFSLGEVFVGLKGANKLNDLGKLGKACGPNSFSGDTRVLMADGTSKRIDEIKVGDKVANSEPESRKTEQHEVLTVHVTDADKEYVDLTISTLLGPRTIRTTAHHLFCNATNGEWVDAAELNVGDELNVLGDRRTTIVGQHAHSASIRTYDLSVAEVHTYYVLAGNTAVLVHNSGCGPDLSGVGGQQFGKKWGQHSKDYGLKPGDPAARQWFVNRINEVRGSHDEVRRGPWNPEQGGGHDY